VHYTGLPPPPPTVALNKITSLGLAQFANALPNYNRQDIYTYTNGASSLTGLASPSRSSIPGRFHRSRRRLILISLRV